MAGMSIERMIATVKKERDVPCRIKTYQMVALMEYGNTVCRAHWTEEQVIEAFKKRGADVEVRKMDGNDLGGCDLYIVVNCNHKGYNHLTGGRKHVKI